MAASEFKRSDGTWSLDRTYRVGFLLTPDFSLMCFANTLDALRAANRYTDAPAYEWEYITGDFKPTASSSGVEVNPTVTMEDVAALDRLIVVGGFDIEHYGDEQTCSWLRRMARSGCAMGAISTGSYVLARAGLLDGYRCTVHWEYADSFAESFPALNASSDLYVIDGDRFTCSGGTASLDMMLIFIADEHNRELSLAVAENFVHSEIRDHSDHQRLALQNRLGVSHPKVLAAVSLMEEALEETLHLQEIAGRLGITARQLQRLFHSHVGCSPYRYYLEARLERARRMLWFTSMPVLHVAVACGFASASHFSKAYRQRYDLSPRADRLNASRSPVAKTVSPPTGPIHRPNTIAPQAQRHQPAWTGARVRVR